MSPKQGTPKKFRGFTDEERVAMKERAQELKGADNAEGDGAVLAKIAAMPEPDRAMGKRVHAIIKANLDEGALWPTAFALKELTATAEAKIGALVKKAVI